MLKYIPAGLTQNGLKYFAFKSPPYHVTGDAVSVLLERLEVARISGHRTVRGRRCVLAVTYERTENAYSLHRERAYNTLVAGFCDTGPMTQRRIDSLIGSTGRYPSRLGNYAGTASSVSLPPEHILITQKRWEDYYRASVLPVGARV